jgi:pyrroline-5-carboxylate reductase
MKASNKKYSTILFLGGGRITSAMCEGLRLAGYRGPLTVYDHNPQKMRALTRESHVKAAPDLKSALKRTSMLVLAVRPGSVPEMLKEVQDCGVPPGLCVSLAAGVPFTKLRMLLPKARWVRTMPSPVCRIARGLTAVCFDRRIGKSERIQVRTLFSLVGKVVEIPERQFDAFTATFSSSHGYHALKTLAEQARRAGLDRKIAMTAAAHALCEGIFYWRESGTTLEELLHEAATPGGTAAATMNAMDQSGYAQVVAKGLAAGIGQALKNAKS